MSPCPVIPPAKEAMNDLLKIFSGLRHQSTIACPAILPATQAMNDSFPIFSWLRRQNSCNSTHAVDQQATQEPPLWSPMPLTLRKGLLDHLWLKEIKFWTSRTKLRNSGSFATIISGSQSSPLSASSHSSQCKWISVWKTNFVTLVSKIVRRFAYGFEALWTDSKKSYPAIHIFVFNVDLTWNDLINKPNSTGNKLSFKK